MSIKQLEAIAVAVGGVVLCAGVGAMLVNFLAGAAIIGGACLLIFGAGVWVRIRDRRNRRQQAPAAPDWHVINEELPPWLSDAELEMLRANKLITQHRWPLNHPGLQHHEHPLDICREER